MTIVLKYHHSLIHHQQQAYYYCQLSFHHCSLFAPGTDFCLPHSQACQHRTTCIQWKGPWDPLKDKHSTF